MILGDRLRFVDVPGAGAPESLAETVRRGLESRPKTLPPRLFYDHVGSELFERITDLPEYYPTRTEAAILEAHADAIVGEATALVEFGSGSSRKTRLLIEAALRRQGRLDYVPIDISRDFLRESSEALLREYPGLSVQALAGEYSDAARALPTADGPRLILFLGSNVGNLADDEAVAFLSRVRAGMRPEDRLLVGTDMVKDRAVLEAAYDDPQGVTAAFNLNLLARINRELGGRFNLGCFAHAAPWDLERRRIEMRLVSRRAQSVRIDALDASFDFAEGEPIVTEWSQKYDREGFAALATRAGLAVERTWADERDWFVENLLAPA